MTDFPLLTILMLLPCLGVLFIVLIQNNSEAEERNIFSVGLWISVVTFFLSLYIWGNFNPQQSGFQFEEIADWIPSFGIKYHLGVDGISLLFVVLTTFLTPLCILTSWDTIKDRVKEYLICFLLLESFLIGVFCSLDIVLFYIFFEAVLIPMYIIIGVWGGARRIYASLKFFLYTLLGSVLLLIAILYMYFKVGSGDYNQLVLFEYDVFVQQWLFLAFFASFAVKIPMWPFHTWLPDAHVEAPTAGSVILAGIMLKMGGYGFIRFSIPLFPDATETFSSFIFALSLIAIIYTSLVALVQEDMKKLIAYSSVAHMGFVTLGAFTLNVQGVTGAMMQMISHGLVSAALFLCVGVIYDQMHTRLIARYHGLVERMPAYALVFMVFIFASAGLPGTSGFVGEFLVLLGSFKVNTWLALLASVAMVLGAAYGLWLYRRIIFGKLTSDSLKSMLDLNFRERLIFIPLVVLVILFGVYPKPILKVVEPAVKNILKIHNLKKERNKNFISRGKWVW